MRIHSNTFEITFGLQDDRNILYFNSFSPYEGHDLQIWFELKIFSFSLSFHFCIVVLETIVCVDASENSFSTGSWSASREGSRR